MRFAVYIRLYVVYFLSTALCVCPCFSDSVSVLPVDSGGRFTKFPTISEAASDLAFSPFHDRLLGTGGNGCVRLWEVPSDLPGDTIISKPVLSLSVDEGKRVEMLRFHPTADNVSILDISV